MKYCIKCGKQIEEENKFCPNCGHDQTKPIVNKINNQSYYQNIYYPNQNITNKYQGNTLGLVSIGLGVTIPVIGMICGVNAISKGAGVSNKLAKILGMSGIVISIIAWIMNMLTL